MHRLLTWVPREPENQDFNWLMGLGSAGVDPGTFSYISGAAVLPPGVFVVSDGLGTVSFFLPNGTYAGRIGRQGSQPGGFDKIGFLLVVQSGSLLVPDRGDSRIQEIVVDVASLRPVKVVPEGIVELAPGPIVSRAFRTVWRRRPRLGTQQ